MPHKKVTVTMLGPKITYHGRTGQPLVHIGRNDRKFIMVRKKKGGTKRLYEGSFYHPGPKHHRGRKRRLIL